MKLRQFIKIHPAVFITLVFMLAICVLNFFVNIKVALFELACLLVMILVLFLFINKSFTAAKKTVSSLNDSLSDGESGNLMDFPLPILIFDSTDRILWYNILFRNYVIGNNEFKNDSIKNFTNGRGLEEISNSQSFEAKVGEKEYTVYFSHIDFDSNRAYALYFVDDTDLKAIKSEYELSKPVVLLVTVDSLDEIVHSYRETESAEIVANIELITESWFSEYSGVFRKLGNGRFISVVSEKELEKMLQNKFFVLEQVRDFTYAEKKVGVTLSIGAGRGKNLNEAELAATQALDMALGRGGDQLALKNTDESYTFIGGVSSGVERHTKVRSRIMASALAEIISTSDNVIIMGHKFSDLDSLGASMGVLKICRDLGKEARIVLSPKTSLASPLINYLKENNLDGSLVLPDYAEHMMDEKTLLIIVDTHRADFLESKKIYEKAKQVVVIDHHRKTVDYIQNAVIFYHEPRASSASEMVTEITQYIPAVKLDGATANSLLSGIMLDTKNFVLRAGARTFEAAAYLRSSGADTVTVKQFFNDSLENRQLRGQVVLSAYQYKNFAISVSDINSKDLRLICAQAADELLTINSVQASFVLFKTGETVNISARSMGAVNVQVIMEYFGGGGHQTMAACQIEGGDLEKVKNDLEKAIDKYLEEQ